MSDLISVPITRVKTKPISHSPFQHLRGVTLPRSSNLYLEKVFGRQQVTWKGIRGILHSAWRVAASKIRSRVLVKVGAAVLFAAGRALGESAASW